MDDNAAISYAVANFAQVTAMWDLQRSKHSDSITNVSWLFTSYFSIGINVRK